MYKYTKYKQQIDTAVQQNALNKIHTRSCAEIVHKSLYDVHATRGSRSVRSQGANSVQIVSSFNLHFSSADRVPSIGTKGAGEIPVAKFKAKEIRSRRRSRQSAISALFHKWCITLTFNHFFITTTK